MAGLSTAYELMDRGLTVAVIDRGKIGRGMTSRTTAHLTNFCDEGSAELISMRGEEIARLFVESQTAGIKRIEEICDGSKIACNFRRLDGFLFPDPQTTQADLDEEMSAVRSLGIKVEKVHNAPVAGYEGKGVLRYPRSGDIQSRPIPQCASRDHRRARRQALCRHGGERGRGKGRRRCRTDPQRRDHSGRLGRGRHQLTDQ